METLAQLCSNFKVQRMNIKVLQFGFSSCTELLVAMLLQ